MAESESVEVILREGEVLRVRPVREDDGRRIEEFFYRMSPRTRYLRFKYAKEEITAEELKMFTTQEPPARYAVVGSMGDGPQERIVAVARWFPPEIKESQHPEFIVVVEDDMQFRGIGTALFERLAQAAHRYKVPRFVTTVLPENANMIEVLENSGFGVKKELKEGMYLVSVDLDVKDEFFRRMDVHERIARAAGVRRFLYPRNVAVIGASRDPESVGGAVFKNMLSCSFKGAVFPVNPNATSVGGVMCYPSVLDVPADVDLAVVVVPARFVVDVAEQCGRKGVRSMVVISAGFAEAGPGGAEIQRGLKEKLVGYGIRLVGPNCLGIMNTDPEAGLNATFSPVSPPAGNISISTQSGALGLALIDYARSLDLGLAHFVSIGNRVDISSLDLLEFWADDPHTELILLYEESFGDPRAFSRIARRVSKKTPIIAVKAGRSEVGAKAASSHTGALAASDIAVDLMFRQAGVIRVDTIEEMFNVARAMSKQPYPRGKRVGILTNAGGPGVLAADACEGWGLKVQPLSEETQKRMREFLPPSAATGNPVDMIASASPESYGKCLSLMLKDPGIDSVIVIYIPPMVTRPEDVEAALKGVLDGYDGNKPVFTCFMMLERPAEDLRVASGRRIPAFTFPEDAVQALARSHQYCLYANRPEGEVPVFEDIDRKKARRDFLSSASLKPEAAWLMPEAALALLGAYGIKTPETRVALSAKEAAEAAAAIGFPVAVKLRSSSIVHKTEFKGVALDLKSGDEVRAAYEGMFNTLKEAGREDEMQGVVIQPMSGGGGGTQELILGMSQDPLFGPLVMVGLGGIHVELLKDIAFSLHPLTKDDPGRMLESLKGYPLLKGGWRGMPALDLHALRDAVLRFSALIEDFPEVEQADINPMFLLQEGRGCLAVDARMRVKAV